MEYLYHQKILFKHCDPAGIVFYPRYFEMMNDCVEAFFNRALGYSFVEVHKDGGGVPTAEITTRFTAPSRMGDQLTLHLTVRSLGRTSMGIRITARQGDDTRFEMQSTLVHINNTARPHPWPDAIRDKVQGYLEKTQDDA